MLTEQHREVVCVFTCLVCMCVLVQLCVLEMRSKEVQERKICQSPTYGSHIRNRKKWRRGSGVRGRDKCVLHHVSHHLSPYPHSGLLAH